MTTPAKSAAGVVIPRCFFAGRTGLDKTASTAARGDLETTSQDLEQLLAALLCCGGRAAHRQITFRQDGMQALKKTCRIAGYPERARPI
jgi:hypothetical protein